MKRERGGAAPLGAAAVKSQHPHTRPQRVKKSPAPRCHAASREIRRQFYEAYSWFVAAFRTAAEKLKRGDPQPGFPVGCFPPGMPFVRA